MLFLSSFKCKIFIIITITLILSSCLTIETDLKLNSDGSGIFKILYSLDKTLNDISNFGNEDDIIPLNLSRGYIEDIIGESTDLVLSKYTSSEDDLFYKVNVTFEFKTIDDLNKLLPNENSFSLTQDGDESILSQGISSGDSGDINEESLNILRDIYGDHYFRFLVNVPRDIISVTNGTKTEDRVAVYQESFVDIIASSENKAWSIRW